MHPVERLLNLVALLRSSRGPLTFDQIRRALEAYGQRDHASAKRMFERDKDVLRELGIPVDLVPTDAWESEHGYTIRAEEYELPEISFTPEEAAALFVAAQGRPEDGEALEGFRKLATGVEGGALAAVAPGDVIAGVAASGPHLAALADATSRRRRIRFGYRPVRGEAGEREVDAWALVFRRGAWYLVGLDRERGEPRSFRLSRIGSEIRDVDQGSAPPQDFDAGSLLKAGPWGLGAPVGTARVALAPSVSWWALASVPGARAVGTRGDGWTEAVVPAGDSFVSWMLSFGPDAEVLSPEDLRRAMVDSLERVRASL